MTDLTDTRIKQLLEQYERKRKKEKERYERIKTTPEFLEKNRMRAKNYYHDHKESKKNKYIENRDLLNARSSYYYYKKLDKIELFKEKCPQKVKLLEENNIQV